MRGVGNGERGDGKADLDYVLTHGPLFEAWVQRRDLPFVMIAPQLPLFDQGDDALGTLPFAGPLLGTGPGGGAALSADQLRAILAMLAK
jgi:hypothetical protein